uniref:Uncharacterized protein n=1 Tax=viral metagenome TaxID=1070528 RepID=A0A6C0F2E6_9ZZZZ
MNYSKSRRRSIIVNTNNIVNTNTNAIVTEAYYLSHNGLGDLIISTSAVRFLLKFYNRVHLLCSHIHHEQMKLILIDEPRIILIPVKMNAENIIFENCYNVLKYAFPICDMYICGGFTKLFLSTIRNEYINAYVPNNELYNLRYDTITDENSKFIYEYYNTINLDLRIYYEYFNIPSVTQSRELYDLVKDYKRVIFTQIRCSSNIKLNIDGVKSKYMKDDDAIILCNDENIYDEATNPTKYNICQRFIKNNIAWYIDTILNCNEIYIIDSCFIAIVLPLVKTNRLKADIVRIIRRDLVNEILL